MRHRKVWLIVALSFAVSAVVMFASPGAVAASGASTGRTNQVCTSASVSKSVKKVADGQALTVVNADCTSIIYAGPVGSTVSYQVTSNSSTAAFKVPNLKNRAIPPASIADAAAFRDITAVGFSKAQAEAMIASATGEKVSSSLHSYIRILGTPCVAIRHANGGQATGRTCDIMTLIQRNGYNWYIGDKLTTSGHNGTWWNNLNLLRGGDSYTKGNSVVEWNPSGYQKRGSCHTVSESVGWNGSGVSSSQTVCPDGIGPSNADPTTGFASQWTGCSSTIQSSPGVDIIHSPPNASASNRVFLRLAWSWC